MRVVIIREDNYVSVDGLGLTVDLTNLDPNLHAVQWYDTFGHIERQGQPNETLISLEAFQPVLLRWQEAKAALPPEPTLPQVPQEISKAQGIATLMERGYWPAVNTYFTTQASPETLTLFNAVTVFNRTSPLLLQMQTMLGIPDAEVDQMFIDGAKKVI